MALGTRVVTFTGGGRDSAARAVANERELAYDREFRLSPLDEAYDHAAEFGITLVSLKRDWNALFA